MKLITRKQWGARAPKNVSRLGSTRGVKVHYEGDHISTALATDHRLCASQVRNIQTFHMDTRGWSDIAYNALVCPHGSVYVGRGPHVLCAANGPGLNFGHYAVCGLVGDSGLTQPSPAMLNGIRDAIEWLRAEGGAGSEIKGHRDGYSTSCPGEPLYAWVRKGAPRPNQQEDDMSLTTKETFDAVWHTDAIPSPGPDPKNPTWAPASYLTDIDGKVRQLIGQGDAQGAALDEVVTELTNVKGVLTQLVSLLTPTTPPAEPPQEG